MMVCEMSLKCHYLQSKYESDTLRPFRWYGRVCTFSFKPLKERKLMPLSPRGLLATLAQEQPHHVWTISVYPKAQVVGYADEYFTPREVRELQCCMKAIHAELTTTGAIAAEHGTSTFCFAPSDKLNHVIFGGTECSIDLIEHYLRNLERILELLNPEQMAS